MEKQIKGYIYVLVSSKEPENYRYLGMTTHSPTLRYNQHMSDARKDNKRHVYKWMRKQLKEGYEIKLKVVQDVYEDENIHQLEMLWIDEINKRRKSRA